MLRAIWNGVMLSAALAIGVAGAILDFSRFDRIVLGAAGLWMVWRAAK